MDRLYSIHRHNPHKNDNKNRLKNREIKEVMNIIGKYVQYIFLTKIWFGESIIDYKKLKIRVICVENF